MSLIGGLLNRIASLAEATRTPLGESSAKAFRAASALTPQQVVAPAVRVATAVAVVLAVLAAKVDTPQKLPDAALGSEWVLRAERGLLVLLPLLFFALILVRGLVEGVFPQKVGKDSIEYAKAEVVADRADKSIQGIQNQIDKIEARAGQDVVGLTNLLGAATREIRDLRQEIEALRAEVDNRS